MKKRIIKKIFDWTINILYYLVLLFVVYHVLQVFVCATFKIPSGSMEPTIAIGDNVLVNKLAYGARIFDVTQKVKHGDIYRMPGFTNVKRNDIIVFNNPRANRKIRHSLSFDVLKYFIKRCVALPGDTFEIINCHYHVRGCNEPLGNVAAQDDLERHVCHLRHKADSDTDVYRYLRSYPKHRDFPWTIENMGPIYIPKEGDQIELNSKNFILYGKLMNWEMDTTITEKDGRFFVGDSLIESYTFDQNYYFVCGDNAVDSQDSRYWGLVPEEFIAGKALMVWYSYDKFLGRTRWERIGTWLGN